MKIDLEELKSIFNHSLICLLIGLDESDFSDREIDKEIRKMTKEAYDLFYNKYKEMSAFEQIGYLVGKLEELNRKPIK